MTAAAGFLLAAEGDVDFKLLLALLVGTSLVIACGCVINNILDRSIDKKMARTKQRALVTGDISVRNAMIYGIKLGVIGTVILVLYTNVLTAAVGLFGLFAYLVLYGLGKRKSEHGTLIGSISGAVPPLAGYTAVTNQLDAAAVLLFLILVFWQMPHFYAIALYRIKEYKAAGLPVLPAKRGANVTVWQMFVYIMAYIVATCLLTVYGYTGWIYMIVMLITGTVWLSSWFKDKSNIDKWAKRMFLVSLLVLTIFSVAVSVDSFFV